jgi:hypothetical protein
MSYLFEPERRWTRHVARDERSSFCMRRTAEALDILPSLAKKVTCEVVTRLARVGMGPKEAMALLGLEVELQA